VFTLVLSKHQGELPIADVSNLKYIFFWPGMSPEAHVWEHKDTARTGAGMGNGVAEAPARVEDRAPIGPAEGLEAGTVAESDPAVGNLRAICEGEGVAWTSTAF
jgi:hypothetical protein